MRFAPPSCCQRCRSLFWMSFVRPRDLRRRPHRKAAHRRISLSRHREALETTMESPIRGIFFDAGNTLLYPRVEELAQELTDAGFPATTADFHAAERLAKKKFDEWLWPLLESDELPPAVDRLYW